MIKKPKYKPPVQKKHTLNPLEESITRASHTAMHLVVELRETRELATELRNVKGRITSIVINDLLDATTDINSRLNLIVNELGGQR